MTTKFTEAVRFESDVTFGQDLVQQFPRNALKEESKSFPQALEEWKVWNDVASNLPTTAASDDLEVYDGTHGTDAIALSAGDVKTLTGVRFARKSIILPAEYKAGASALIRVRAGMLTTISDTTCTIDIQAYINGEDGAVDGSDIVTTSPVSINSLTFADYDFAMTATSLDPGDILDVRLTVTYVDAASGTEVRPLIGSIKLVCNCQG